MITNHDKLKCVLRELGYRRHVYARRVNDGFMTEKQARLEIDLMTAIAEDYRVLARQDKRQGELPLEDNAA